MISRSTATPPAKESATVSGITSQYGRPQSSSCQAMKVENIAISPWAKFRWWIAW